MLVSFTARNNPEVRNKYLSILKSFKYKNKLFQNIKDSRGNLSLSYFVISPPGNGIYFHRTWEAFIHKTIPDIEKNMIYFQILIYQFWWIILGIS